MDFLNYLFSAAALWLWVLAAAAVVGLIYINRQSFGVNDFLYTFPLVGRLARFSKDYSEANRGDGWLNVENTLCRDYAKHCTAISEAEFNNNILYLKKTYDHGRRDIPASVWVILGLLVIMEGVGFAYMLGGFMASEASENFREVLTVGIVLVLAIILIWVTHQAGHQWFRTSLLRHCFREYQKDKRPERVFSSEIVSLDDDQEIDQRQPAHVQCANRVISKPGDLGSHAWVWIAALLILTIAVGSTVLRLETLHTSQIEDAQAPAFPGGDVPAEFADPAAATAPAAPAAAAADPAAASKENAALAGFVMLAMIFVVTQLVGIGVGLRYGFAGKQSRLAHKATHGAADYASYFAPVERRMMIADSRLLKLHQLLERHSPTPIAFTKNFFDFVRDEQDRGATNLHMPPAWKGRKANASKANGHARHDEAEAAEFARTSEAVGAQDARGEEGIQ